MYAHITSQEHISSLRVGAVCIDTLLRGTNPLYHVKMPSEGALLRSLSEYERNTFGTRSERLRSTNQKALKQTACNAACVLYIYFIIRTKQQD